ncbi:MAG TPA: hypothetical protein H9681_07500 [Firmicutes bacterium]|nr:hypothetical protein [Bacillota bacterium]
MKANLFSKDITTDKPLNVTPGEPISEYAAVIGVSDDPRVIDAGRRFSAAIDGGFVSDFEKSEHQVRLGHADQPDKMAHVSTFIVIDGFVYMTYYANTKEPSEDPKNQTARLVWAPLSDLDNKTYLDVQASGDSVDGHMIDMVYDTILMRWDENTIYVMWTARTDGNYYRFIRPFDTRIKQFGDIKVNRFKVGEVTNDFSSSGIRSALAANGIPCKTMYSDIGIMQKLTSRVEEGAPCYYTGAYSGDFNCIIKSRDLVTWEYVSQPDFPNESKWENAVYIKNDKCYYFVRQQDGCPYGFLTVYDLESRVWSKPVGIADCQSRSDFIEYHDGLYLFHAPVDRRHIGIVRIDTDDIANSKVVLQAEMSTGCFYPFVQYYQDGELAMSYTVDRKHIRLARFRLSDYLG